MASSHYGPVSRNGAGLDRRDRPSLPPSRPAPQAPAVLGWNTVLAARLQREVLFDLDAWGAWSGDPQLFVAQRVDAQYWSRDPGSSFAISLSDALEFLLEP